MKYEAVIGLEVHAELSTKSKIYCSCSTGFGAPINTHTCPVCTGMPGALPVLNKQVVHYAAKMGKATGCTINQLCKADRKNYFYPDNPKAYQIRNLTSQSVTTVGLKCNWKTAQLRKSGLNVPIGRRCW